MKRILVTIVLLSLFAYHAIGSAVPPAARAITAQQAALAAI